MMYLWKKLLNFKLKHPQLTLSEYTFIGMKKKAQYEQRIYTSSFDYLHVSTDGWLQMGTIWKKVEKLTLF